MRHYRELICSLFVLSAAPLVSGAVYTLNLVDCGGIPGSLGNPITWTGGSPAAPTTVDLRPPTAAEILIDPSLARTSYFAMDSLGLSSPTYTSNRDIFLLPGSSITANSASGIFLRQTGATPSGPGDRIIIMSLMVRTASAGSLTTQGVLVNLRDSVATHPDGVLGAVRFGAANASNNSGLWAQSYYLDAVVIPDTSGGFPTFVQYEISVVAVPAPSTAALGIIAGFYTRRRAR